ncbi:hypothetical protein [Bosea sp. LC85]|nr:hypothetical protein [Bosea sp. LC85]
MIMTDKAIAVAARLEREGFIAFMIPKFPVQVDEVGGAIAAFLRPLDP